jgi:glycosyltransferase involved in cell wall biosynthesis
MKILVIAPEFPHAGSISGHRIVYERVRRLLARGHEVGVACFRASAADEQRVEEWGGRLSDVLWLPDTRTGHPGHVPPWPWPLRRTDNPAIRRAVGDLVERSGYALLLVEFSSMAGAVYWNRYLPAVRRVMSVHECETVAARRRAELMGYGWAGLRERWRRDRLMTIEFELYRAFDLVLTLTPQEQYHLLQYAPDLRVRVVPSGVDTTFFRPAERPVPLDGIAFVGHFGHEQNRDAVRWFLKSVWPKVRDHHPGLLFYVIGPDPPPDIRDVSWSDPSVVVTGRVEDIRPYLHRSFVFVCPIRMGSGMRGRLLEAMACGVPVVATSAAVEGIPVQPGGTCLIADDSNIMAAHIELLLDDTVLRQRLATRARALVRERLSWERTVDWLEAALREVMEEAAAPRDAHTAKSPSVLTA